MGVEVVVNEDYPCVAPRSAHSFYKSALWPVPRLGIYS